MPGYTPHTTYAWHKDVPAEIKKAYKNCLPAEKAATRAGTTDDWATKMEVEHMHEKWRAICVDALMPPEVGCSDEEFAKRTANTFVDPQVWAGNPGGKDNSNTIGDRMFLHGVSMMAAFKSKIPQGVPWETAKGGIRVLIVRGGDTNNRSAKPTLTFAEALKNDLGGVYEIREDFSTKRYGTYEEAMEEINKENPYRNMYVCGNGMDMCLTLGVKTKMPFEGRRDAELTFPVTHVACYDHRPTHSAADAEQMMGRACGYLKHKLVDTPFVVKLLVSEKMYEAVQQMEEVREKIRKGLPLSEKDVKCLRAHRVGHADNKFVTEKRNAAVKNKAVTETPEDIEASPDGE
jgi:hypothetical protein